MSDPGASLDELASLASEALSRIGSSGSIAELRELDAEVLGRRSVLAQVLRRLGSLEPDERRAKGKALQEVRERLRSALDARESELAQTELHARLESDRLDLTELLSRPRIGHLHLVTQTQIELEDTFIGMGFTIAEGPEAETDWNNFGALNFPPFHPARDAFDSLYLKLGNPGSVLLRTHTSPVQVRVMESQPPPIYSVMPGRCYRRETPDARHIPTFNQIEGLVVDTKVSFGDLAGTIEEFTTSYFGPQIHSRLRPASFPFTEPSAEFEVTCPICEGSGCRTCSDVGWIELGGCGMVDPAVFAAVGIDGEVWSGFAFGFGIDRCAQVRHQLGDVRVLLDNDVRFLSQF